MNVVARAPLDVYKVGVGKKRMQVGHAEPVLVILVDDTASTRYEKKYRDTISRSRLAGIAAVEGVSAPSALARGCSAAQKS